MGSWGWAGFHRRPAAPLPAAWMREEVEGDDEEEEEEGEWSNSMEPKLRAPQKLRYACHQCGHQNTTSLLNKENLRPLSLHSSLETINLPMPVVNFEFMSAKTAEMQSDWFTDFEPQLSFLPRGGGQGEGWTPSGCCSRRGSFRPRAACQRRSTSAGPGGCPPCPGSWPSRSRWCRRARPQG